MLEMFRINLSLILLKIFGSSRELEKEMKQAFEKVFKTKQDCSYQGEALKTPTAFYRLWSSNNIPHRSSMDNNRL